MRHGGKMGKTDGGVKKKFTEALKSGSSIIACYEDLFDASRIALFGFDAASRRYGLVDTVESICAVDSEVSQNPIGEIYEKLEPNIDKRHKLIDEMSQISLDSCEYPYDVKVGTMPKITITADGEVREKGVNISSSRSRWRSRGEAPEILDSFRNFIEGLERDEPYQELANEASQKNTSILELLVSGTRAPSLSRLFLKLEAELASQAKSVIRILRVDGVDIADRTEKIIDSIENKYEEELEKYADIKQTLNIKLAETPYDDMRQLLEESVDKVDKLTTERRNEIDNEISDEISKYLQSVDCSETMLEWIEDNKKHLNKIIDDLDYIAKRR